MLIAALSTYLQLERYRQQNHSQLEELLTQIGNYQLESISESVWIANAERIESQLSGFLSRDIEVIDILDQGDLLWSVGYPEAKSYTMRQFSLEKRIGEQIYPLGIMRVRVALDPTEERLQQWSMMTLMANFFTILAIILFILYLFHLWVNRYLDALLTHTDSLDYDSINLPFKLPGKRNRGDMVDKLVAAFNQMQNKLATAFLSLSDSEHHNKLLLESTTDGILGLNLQGEIKFVNQAALRTLRYQRQELEGELNYINIHPTFNSEHKINDLSERQSGEPILVKQAKIRIDNFRRNGGSYFPVEYSRVPLINGDRVQGAVVTFRDISEKKRLDELLYSLATGISNKSGDEFYTALVDQLTSSLGNDLTYVATFDPKLRSFTTLAANYMGRRRENFNYKMVSTPCERVISKNKNIYTEDLRHDFPEALHLIDLGMQTYIASPLVDINNHAIGTLVVLHHEQVSTPDHTIALLEIFANRTSIELQREESEKKLRLAATAFETNEAICITDPQGEILRVNRAFERVTGFSSEECIGQNTSIMRSGRHNRQFYTNLWNRLLQEGYWEGEIWNRRRSGEIFPLWQHITAVKDARGQIVHYVASFVDITERKIAEERINQMAFYDTMTGLPNRTLLVDRIQQAFTNAQLNNHFGALLLFDVDDFKSINDSVGRKCGDQILAVIADRIAQEINSSETLAKAGGDVFAVLIPHAGTQKDIATKAAQGRTEKIRAMLTEPIVLNEISFVPTQSVGITLFPLEEEDAATVLTEADTALNKAKSQGRGKVQFYHPEMQALADRKIALLSNMHQALDKAEFCMYFQPQVNGAEKIIGAESLIRWQHPKLGIVNPSEFIPLAEESGMIVELGYWVMSESCNIMKAWADKGLIDDLHHIAINISPLQFHQPDFVSQVIHIVKESGIDPNFLELELTEGLLIQNINEVIEKMTILMEMGIHFSVDDFGTGYSSLSYLKRLPISKIKIDQSFIKDVTTNERDAAIVESIISISRSLGFGIIAEGVDSQESFEFLRDHGCEVYQGFKFSRALPAADFIAKLNPS